MLADDRVLDGLRHGEGALPCGERAERDERSGLVGDTLEEAARVGAAVPTGQGGVVLGPTSQHPRQSDVQLVEVARLDLVTVALQELGEPAPEGLRYQTRQLVSLVMQCTILPDSVLFA